AVALDEEDLGTDRARAGAVRELAGKAQLARRALAVELALRPALQALLGALDDGVQKRARALLVAGEPMVEMVLERALAEAARLGRREFFLRLPLELRRADEEREEHHRAAHHVLGRDLLRPAVLRELAIGLEASRQGGAEPLLMRPALGRRDG